MRLVNVTMYIVLAEIYQAQRTDSTTKARSNNMATGIEKEIGATAARAAAHRLTNAYSARFGSITEKTSGNDRSERLLRVKRTQRRINMQTAC